MFTLNIKRMRPLIFIISITVILLAACSKEKIKQPEFDVNTSALTYKKGEEITFKFTGSPDNITFYSGETGKSYDYRNRTTLPGKLQIQFSSLVDRGLETTCL